MPKFIVKQKAEIIKEINWQNGQQAFSIGSEPDNDLMIEDKLVSMHHVKIESRENKIYVNDLDSAFGTYLNGVKISGTAELSDGDKLQIGEHAIFFDNPLEKMEFSVAGDQAENFKDSARLDALEDAIRKESFTVFPQEGVGVTEFAPYYLLSIYGPYAGKRYQLRYGDTKIGRDETLNDIILAKNKAGEPDHSISRRHTTISYRQGSIFVSDKRSKTRTHVNKTVVPVDGEIEIFPDDEIEIVSDQQSTIFRFVNENDDNFSPPKKAGVWWVRYRTKFIAGVATVAVLAGGFLAATGFLERSMLTQQPDPLSVELSYWSADKSVNLQDMELSSLEFMGSFKLAPALSDFNGDGYIDIATTNITGKPMLIDGKTQVPAWIIDTLPADPEAAMISADINQNELDDLIYVSSDGRIVAIDGQHGAEIWTSPFFNVKVTGPPVVADFNGDGMVDVAIADIDGNIHIGYNQVFTMDWTTLNTGIPIIAPLSSSDLDGDGDSELLCGSERGIVFLIDGTSRNIIGTIDMNEMLNQALGTFYEDNQIRHAVGIVDLNNDGRDDFVVSSVQGRILAIDGADKKRLWHAVLSEELTLNPNYPFPFALGDVNNDGINDVVVGTDKGEIIAYDGKGNQKQNKVIWKVKADNSSPVYQGLLLGDINKDQMSDVAYVDQSGIFRLIDGKTSRSLIETAELSSIQTSMPFAADLQRDGFLDILLMTKTGIVFQYKTNSRVPKSSVLWGQLFGQNKNTLTQTYRLPETTNANLSMALGFVIFAGGFIPFFMRRRKR